MIFISLGSNVGNRLNNLCIASRLIKKNCLYDTQDSIVLETEAILANNTNKEWDKPFLNMIIYGKTDLSPTDLLHNLKAIEKQMGRETYKEKWSPRIIDIDILLYNDMQIHTEYLQIPHPELKNRKFFQHLMALMQKEPYVFEKNFQIHFSKSYTILPKIVGIVNVTTDSFSDGGQFYNSNDAIKQIIKLSQDGASIIEIGAQSTKHKAIIQPEETEHLKLIEILEKASDIIDKNQLQISIDTFRASIATDLIKKYKINIINDVIGDFDDNSLKKIANSDCKFCLMNSVKSDNYKQNATNTDIIDQIIEWGHISLEKLIKIGFSINNIILDPGIGFNKTRYQSISILKNIKKLKNLGCNIMIGHSRKNYIRSFSEEEIASNRDIETIGISLAVMNSVNYLRVHNVRDHMRAIVAYKSVQEI